MDPPFAAALHYQYGAQAPTLSASGAGDIAKQLVSTAKRYGVPIHQSPGLASELQKLVLSEQIPPELYDEVAVLLTSKPKR